MLEISLFFYNLGKIEKMYYFFTGLLGKNREMSMLFMKWTNQVRQKKLNIPRTITYIFTKMRRSAVLNFRINMVCMPRFPIRTYEYK